MDAFDDAGVEVMALLPRKDFYPDDAAALAVFQPQRAVFNIARFVAEDRTQEALLGRQLGLAFRRYFADQNIAGAHLGTDAHHAVLVEIAQFDFRNVGDVVSGFFRPQLGVAHVADKLLDVYRGKLAVLDHALGDDDGVFVVGSAPAHKGDKRVLAERQLAVVGGGSVGKKRALFDLVADRNARALVQGGKAVGAHKVDQRIFGLLPFFIFNLDDAAVGVAYGAGLKRVDKAAGVARGALLHAGRHQRRLGHDAWRSLLLHVAAHKTSVRVVVLEERDHVGRDRERLFRRYIDIIDIFAVRAVWSAVDAHLHYLLGDAAVFLYAGRAVRDDALFLLGGVEKHDLFGDLAVNHFDVRSFYHAELVEPGKS